MWSGGKYAVFGTVIEGQDVVRKVESVGTQGPTKKPVTITDGGQL